MDDFKPLSRIKPLKKDGWWVAHVILVSAQGPNPSFFFFWGTFIQLGGLFGQGLGLGLGPGLDNFLTVNKN